ncbi:hypothetical protein GCM10009798_25330 [Nocardioides panacihumi]|uniref:Probable 2-phosphosulfolactate phosphatase n=1 Tax=Nocardioides panacihumi TaxID=400774 RepID=A0ABN2R5U1_9ACTN
MIDATHRQHASRVRLEWGPVGAEALAPVDIAVVVDVLSFTTTVTVAVERGIEVLPFLWKDERAAAFAAEHDAVLAVQRQDALRGGDGVSLSPVSLATAQGVRRVVLPSPNGSTVSTLLAGSGATVVAACLRNRRAVAAWLAPRLTSGATMAVVPAGERWPDGSLRPAVEDLWGAGAVLDALGPADLSPEATAAVAAFRAAGLPGALLGCSSGRELVAAGFEGDVDMAAEVDVSEVVPTLVDGMFTAAAAD